MSNENADLIRRAYEAYASGDLAAMLQFVDPDLEWTYLDPAQEHPTPQVCHGRQELEQLLHWAEHGLRAELDEVGQQRRAGHGERADARGRRPPRAPGGRPHLQRVHSARGGCYWVTRR
jgi:ketosteroid isomerase-like protein